MAVLAALNPQLWQSSIVVMSDTTALAAGTLGGWALARYARLGGARWLALSAAALAYAMATRWAYALEALPCAAYGVYLLVQCAGGANGQQPAARPARALAGGAVLGALLLPGLAEPPGRLPPALPATWRCIPGARSTSPGASSSPWTAG